MLRLCSKLTLGELKIQENSQKKPLTEAMKKAKKKKDEEEGERLDKLLKEL